MVSKSYLTLSHLSCHHFNLTFIGFDSFIHSFELLLAGCMLSLELFQLQSDSFNFLKETQYLGRQQIINYWKIDTHMSTKLVKSHAGKSPRLIIQLPKNKTKQNTCKLLLQKIGGKRKLFIFLYLRKWWQIYVQYVWVQRTLHKLFFIISLL